MPDKAWKFWVDRGGTFTDVIGCAPDGRLHTRKLLSDNPSHYPDAAAEGIQRILSEVNVGGHIAEIRMGTTVATNALLERTGAVTALLTTRGFRDVLAIGDQTRPHIFALDIRRPQPLYTEVAEADERVDAAGAVLQALDRTALESIYAAWREHGIESVAICLMHAWRNPEHELAAAALARAYGFREVIASHAVSPLRKFTARTSTTVADAYLSPVLQHYVSAFEAALARHAIRCSQVLFMQSNGGLVRAEHFRGKDSVLSGPAGGVVGMGAAASRAGLRNLIGFDMGGTSTDVSLYAGRPEIAEETLIEGVLLRTPAIKIHTIAAGGGSILNFADGRLQVGPESAGAQPGPRCYGNGGPLTVTDANVMLGRIQPDWFPQIFGPQGNAPLAAEAVRDAFKLLTRSLNAAGFDYSPAETAAGFLAVAVDNMANAIRRVSIQRGLHPEDFTLCCFGGAAGQHACAVADNLGMQRVLVDPLGPVLSAWGMGAAQVRAYRQHAIDRPLSEAALDSTAQLCAELRQQCCTELAEQGIQETRHTVWLRLKVAGTDSALSIEFDSLREVVTAFEAAHAARFGFRPDNTQLEIEAVRVEVESNPAEQPGLQTPEGDGKATAVARVYVQDTWLDVPVYERARLAAGTAVAGPALVMDTHSSVLVEPDWSFALNQEGQLMLERTATKRVHAETPTAVDPVRLEIFNNQFMHIAEQMGTVLQQTARSVNIKERLDFSCALFTPAGDLIANAPHVPVHLGSMDDSVKSVIKDQRAALCKGDSFIVNAPYNGGTHLPDITVISPVTENTELLFVVASRAHHADIGGISPGSMPPLSRHISEEGIVFDNVPIVRDGNFLEDSLRALLTDSEFPARNPEQNIADLKAQLAANERGRTLLRKLVHERGRIAVEAYTRHVQDNAEESVRKVVAGLGDGEFSYRFDNGQEIRVSVSVDHSRREAHIDFTGTSAAGDNNLNAPVSVCRAAALYVFRTLVAADIPLNAGCNKPLRLTIPEGCMLKPVYPAAVVGGNVETSQCITDALYGALGVLAASQGTMNNLSFGDADLQYYETICGGSGAGPTFPGADAVQTHMTNSRMTDAEVLESRFPVLVREFSIRAGSGGSGAQPGGNGAVRKLEFRQPMSAAILSNHRNVQPFGLAGGAAAATGENTVIRKDGRVEPQAGVMTTRMLEGDVLVVKTPGGGGYGVPDAEA